MKTNNVTVNGNADRSILKPGKEYKQEALKVTASILFFTIVYLGLITLAVLLAAFVSFIGIQLIILKPMFITLMVGIGLIGLGVMVIFFLIKFIFTSKKIDRSGYTEIKRNEFPELFNFIENLAKETKTPFPKRIYLTHEVNASVFYDSSFLSMFFPVKKNLLIGLGLVNSVNMSEFKAILAHEFGHFSQHSMRLGVYVFNTNKIIYNMLYDNEGYTNTLGTWAEASGYFALFAALTAKIVQFIQSILRKVYIVVNKANMSLSRQMEHHADTVSAFVAGPNHIISSLNRLEIAGFGHQYLLGKYEKWIPENQKPVNMFEHHSEVMKVLAADQGYEIENGLPKVEQTESSGMIRSRIIFKDQWASHPSNQERDNYLKTLNIPLKTTDINNPWNLFGDFKKVQKELTDQLFSSVKYKDTIEQMDLVSFQEKFSKEHSKFTFDKRYKGFYDNRRISKFDLDKHLDIPVYSSYDELFNNENLLLPKKLEALTSDMELLKNLALSNIKTFDFDGKKYKKKDIPELLKMLEAEEKQLQNQLNNLDIAVYRFFSQKSNSPAHNELKDSYLKYFEISAESENAIKDYNELAMTINPIYSGSIPTDVARKIINDVLNIEKKIKTHFRAVLPELQRDNYLDEGQLKKAENYLSRDRDYFDASGFNNIELDVFNEAIGIYVGAIYEREFRIKKAILDKQLEVLN